MAYKAEHNGMFDAYITHGSQQRKNTATFMYEKLRAQYPEHHVTKASAVDFDISGFVAAGNGDLIKEDDEASDSITCFKRPSNIPQSVRVRRMNRMAHLYHPQPTNGNDEETEDGTVFERVVFGRSSLTWNDHQYILYRLCCSGGPGEMANVYFVLSPWASTPDGSATNKKPTMSSHPDTHALLQAVGNWSSKMHDEISVFDDGCWYKDADLLASARAVGWDDVVHQDSDVKASLRRDVIDFFDNAELYRSLGVPWKRGIILHGEPGNGKTLTLKAIIKTLWESPQKREGREEKVPVPTLYVKALKSGEGESSIRDIFEHARQMAPCLLVFEDLDSIVTAKNRSYFLNEVDGLADNDGILMIGSTNHLAQLDSSITKRPSRFDRKYHFALPGLDGRRAYCDMWRGKILALPRNIDCPAEMCGVVAGWTEGFSFAYMKELFMSAMMLLVTGTHEENDYEDEVLEDAECGSDECSTVVVGRRATGADDEGPAGQDKTCHEETSSRSRKPKRKTLPEVDVPAALENNLLLRILKSQAKALIADMDDSSDDESEYEEEEDEL